MFSALEIIASNVGSPAMLGAEAGLDKSAMVPLVDDIERGGWMIRTRSSTDRRRSHLSITEAGRAELDTPIEQMVYTEAKAPAALTEVG